VFEGGYAASSLAWVRVQPAIAKLTRACSYDRAGYGFSDMGPPPRDGVAVAKDLDDALRAADIKGPFVMVGHSAGALYVRIFADRRPKDVVGMVLVEPSVAHEDDRLAAVAGPGAGSLAAIRARPARCLAAAEAGDIIADPEFADCVAAPPSGGDVIAQITKDEDAWRTEISELDTLWTTTSDEVDAGRKSYGDMPLVVLTADGTYADAPEPLRSTITSAWIRLHQEIAALSTRGSEQLVRRSSHMMIFDRPDAIVSAIEKVVTAARAATGSRPSAAS